MILITAATSWERKPLARLAGARVLETGIGPEKARTALNAVTDARLAISSGFAGALQPGVFCGDIVFDPLSAPALLAEAALEAAESSGVRLHMGRILHSAAVLSSPEAKKKLGAETRSAAVDMETAAVAAWAAQRKIPAIAVRAVLDDLDSPLPASFPADADFLSAVRHALAHPAEWPLYASLAFKQKKAMARLTSFLGAYLPLIPAALGEHDDA